MSAQLQPYVPRLIRAISEEDPPGPRARVLDGSLVSVDMSGFTALAERLAVNGKAGAEELVRRVSSIFDSLIGVAERHGGDVLKFRGDALLLFFTGERHPERACGAASDMQWTIDEVGATGPVRLRMSAGVHAGACHFLLTETPHRELLVCGPAATRVFELEDLAESGEILISAETAARVEQSWLGPERDGGRLLQRLEPGSSRIPPPADVTGRGLDLYVPGSLRDHLAVASGEAEHRRVTVAFLKLSDTDAVIEVDGLDALLERIDALSAEVASACATYGLTWLESDIDKNACKLYLTAGAPSSTGDDAEGMLRGLRSILDAGLGLPLRAGANRGEVFTGDIGAPTRRTYAVMGDAVNLAARLTARAQVGELLATADVLDRARTSYASDREPMLVKGKERAVMAHQVGAAVGRRESAQVDTFSVIGREHELDALRAAIDGARMRQLQLVELVGEAGIGKSRLTRELQTLAVGFQQLHAAADPYSVAIPYSVWPDLLRPLAGITAAQTPEDAGAQLAAWIGPAMPDLVAWLPLLAIPFGARTPSTPEVDALDATLRRDRLHATVETFLERVLMMPTLIVVEDAHWLDDGSRFLLHHLVRNAAPRPWLVLASTRPTGWSFASDGGPGTMLELKPFEREDSEAFALAVAQEHALSTDAVSSLAARAGGNPLFLRELAFAARHGAPDELPESVETLLTERIDTLSPADRLLLRFASVVGPVFGLDLIESILGDEVAGAGDPARWETLGQFVVPTADGELAFRHDLVRATAYTGLSFSRRREIHGRVGSELERRAGERADDDAALLSLHFSEAEDHQRAWRYAAEAGRRAEEGFANVVAAELYDRALASLDALGEGHEDDVVAIAESLGDVCERFGAYDRAGAAYLRVARVRGGDAVVETRLVAKRGSLHERTGAYDEAFAVYEQGLELLDRVDPTPELERNRAEIELCAAGVRYRQGRFHDVLPLAHAAAARSQAGGDRKRLAHADYLCAAVFNELGRADAEAYCEGAIAIFAELGDHLGQGRALNTLGIRLYYTGRWDEAVAAYRRGAAELGLAGDVVGEATLANNESEILSDQGRVDDAVPGFEKLVRVSRAAGYPLGEGAGLDNLARAEARSGRFDEAHGVFAIARALFARIGSAAFVEEARVREAECLVFEGRHAEAIALLEAPVDAGSEATRVLRERTLGLAQHQARRTDEGRAHLERSLQLARDARSEYETALSLRALALTGGGAGALAEAEAILGRLGVVRLPPVPL